jgi:glycosyltransferase involved in cell wall biosynthesis
MIAVSRSKYERSLKKPKNKSPLVTIITVVLNAVRELEATIVSVQRNLRDDVEYIIVDGGSTDGTVDLIREYDDYIDHWISEPDKGIYDAINKAITFSRGHFLYVLNIGDTLLELPYEELLEAQRDQADVVLFNVLLSNGRIVKSVVNYRTRFENTLHHQATFYRREMNIFYDDTLRVSADFDVNQKLFLQRRTFKRFDKLISRHATGGISNQGKHFREYYSVIRRNFGLFWTIVSIIDFRQFLWLFRSSFSSKSPIGNGPVISRSRNRTNSL